MMSADTLRAELERIDQANGDGWYAQLEERKRRESEFHDRMRDSSRIANIGKDQYEEFFSNHRFYRTATLSRAYFFGWIERHSKGKIVLDFACGDGDVALRAAAAGARLAIGIDISGISIENAKRAALERGLEQQTYFLRGDCENTGLPSGSVDVVLCAGVLHHLDVTKAFPEIRRVLAPGGRVLAFEALAYNPLIKLYRNRNPHQRTEWEKAHILGFREVRLAQQYLKLGEVRYFHLASVLGVWLPSLLPALNWIDSVLTRIPGIRLMSWMFTFELRAE